MGLLQLLMQVHQDAQSIPDSWLHLIYWVLGGLAVGCTAAATAIWAAGQKISTFLAKEFFLPIVQRHDKFSTQITDILAGVKETVEKQAVRTESLEKGVAELRESYHCKYNDDNHKE